MRRPLFFTLFALSGAAALIYEVIWTRLLTLEMGHTVAGVSTVLAAFMGGLAIGSAVGGRIGGRLSPEQALKTYGILELVIALLALLLPLGLRALHPLLASSYANGNGGAMFATLRFVSSAAPARGAGGRHGRHVSDRLALDGSSRFAGRARRRCVVRGKHPRRRGRSVAGRLCPDSGVRHADLDARRRRAEPRGGCGSRRHRARLEPDRRRYRWRSVPFKNPEGTVPC